MTLIAHVATRFLGGGAERSVGDIVRALPAPQFEHVLIVGRDHDPGRERALLGDTSVICLPALIRRPDPIRDVQAYFDVRRSLGRLRPSIVHTIESKSGILGRAAARSVGVPTVVHSVVMANFGTGFSRFGSTAYASAERLASRWTDHYIACGADVRDHFVRAGIARTDRYAIVRSTVDADHYRAVAKTGQAAAREALGITPDRPVVLFAGSLDARKGVRDLTPFFVELRRSVPTAHLVIAGDGLLRDELERDLSQAGVRSDVRLLGYTNLMAEAMVAADSLVMLSSAEGLATVLVQAIAAGRPFVSYDVTGPREMIGRGAVGVIAPQGDVTTAARGVAAQLGERGREYPEVDLSEWAPSEVQRRYRAVFNGAISGG